MTEEMDETTNPARDADVIASEAVPAEDVAASALEPVSLLAQDDVEPSLPARLLCPRGCLAACCRTVAVAPVAVAPVAVAPVAAAAVAFAPVVTAPELVPPSRRKQSAVDLISMWLGNLVVSLLTAAFVVIFLYQPVKVEGTSMLPGLEDQERIFVNRFVYRLEPISRATLSFSAIRRYLKELHQALIACRRPHPHRRRPRLRQWGGALRGLRPAAICRLALGSRTDRAAGRVLHDGRPPQHVERQPRFGPVEQKFVVGKAVVRLLAFREVREGEVVDVYVTSARQPIRMFHFVMALGLALPAATALVQAQTPPAQAPPAQAPQAPAHRSHSPASRSRFQQGYAGKGSRRLDAVHGRRCHPAARQAGLRKDAVRTTLKSDWDEPGYSLSWEPSAPRCSKSGRMGNTSGRWTYRGKNEKGEKITLQGDYLNRLAEQADGSWKVIYDGWNARPSGSLIRRALPWRTSLPITEQQRHPRGYE